MKIAVCDDRQDQIQIIKAAAEKYLSQNGELFASVDTFDKAFDFLDAQGKVVYDLVLLDICMPGLIGTDVAKEIRKRKDKTEIIFLTTSDEFAVDAFTLKAAHYLLKPFTQEEFDEAMTRVMAKINSREGKSINVKTETGELYKININDIQYVESHDHSLSFFLTGNVCVKTRETLQQIFDALKTLSEKQFINPYKGYIVNQLNIEKIGSSEIVLRCGAKIPIPRGTSRKLQSVYISYCFSRRKI